MLKFDPLPTALVRALQSGGADANGQPPERSVSDGQGNPCRHCLMHIPKGAGMLICAHRPFDRLQPYAECGPIFLCADACAPYSGADVPPILKSSPDYLLKGYRVDERIYYGTGRIVMQAALPDYAAQLLSDPEVAFVDVRSARNNCYQLRIRRKIDLDQGSGPTEGLGKSSDGFPTLFS